MRITRFLLVGLVSCADTPSGPVETGVWGGTGVALEITASGAALEFDCAHGSIARRPVLDARGRFGVEGVFVIEHGGPIREGETEDARAARYTGEVSDGTMELRIELTADGTRIGPFTLRRDAQPLLRKCL